MGNLSAAVGIGNEGTGAMFAVASPLGLPMAQKGSSAGFSWLQTTLTQHKLKQNARKAGNERNLLKDRMALTPFNTSFGKDETTAGLTVFVLQTRWGSRFYSI